MGAKKGVVRFWQMFTEYEMDSFESISKCYNIANKKLLERTFNDGKLKKTISNAYKILQGKEETWEKILQRTNNRWRMDTDV